MFADAQEENGELKKKQWDEVVVAAENKLKAVTEASKGEAAARSVANAHAKKVCVCL